VQFEQAHIVGDLLPNVTSASAEHHDDTNLFFNHIREVTDNCRVILTERGYMGLASAIVRERDTCDIIFGCRTPCLLRKVAQDQHYMFLGATTLVGKECNNVEGDEVLFDSFLGEEESKDWIHWDVEEQDIYLC
jgi:hypothetical protein